jgi:RHS repeat-associated protein
VVARRLPALLALVMALLGAPWLASSATAQSPSPGVQPLCRTGCGGGNQYSVAVDPAGDPTWALLHSSGNTATFTVINNGQIDDQYLLSCAHSGGVSCTGVSPDTLWLGPGQRGFVDVTYSVGASYGNVYLWARGGATNEGWYVVEPGPPPVVSLAPYSPLQQSAGDGVVYTHTTPVVGSMGVQRALTLTYNSAAAHPVALLAVDASSSFAPGYYSLKVQHNGANLLLLNGADSVVYSAGTTAASRLLAAFDPRADGLTEPFNPVTVVVSAYYGDTAVTTTLGTSVLVNDQGVSPFGSGVGLAGVPRLYFTTGQLGLMLADGSGSYEYFSRSCQTCAFVSPAGESGTLDSTTDSIYPYRLTALDGSIADFSGDGRVLRTRPLPGIPGLTFGWTNGLLKSVTDTTGRGFTLGYTGAGTLDSITDFAGRTTRVTVTNGKLAQVTDPDSRSDNLTYGADSLLTQLFDRTAGQYNFYYNALDQEDSVQAPADTVYGGSVVRPTTRTLTAALVVWQPTISGDSAPVAKHNVWPDTLMASVTDPDSNVSRAALDRFGLPTMTIDALHDTTTFLRDTLGNVTQTQSPRGHIVVYGYSGYLLTSQFDAATSRTMNYTYNAQNRVQTITGGAARLDYFYYDTTQSTFPVGTLKFEYVGDSLASGVWPPAGGDTTAHHYPNAFGQDTAVTDGLGHRTRWLYASVANGGNLLETIDARGYGTSYRTDIAGLVDTTILTNGKTYTVAYDVLGRDSVTTNPLGYSTRYTYGPRGLTRVVDPKGQVYKFDLNAWGLVTHHHDLADTTQMDSVAYDADGNARRLTTQRDDTITMTYDPLGRILTESGAGFPTATFRYGPGGLTATATNANAFDSTQFDVLGRPDTVWQKVTGDSSYRMMAYVYDSLGRLVSRSAPSGGSILSMKYDSALGVLDSLCGAGTCTFVGHDADLRVDSLKYTGGLAGWARYFNYDSLNHVTEHTFSPDPNRTFHLTWAYDAEGRMMWSAQGLAGMKHFDAAGQLTDECVYSGYDCENEYLEAESGMGSPQPYWYDSAGNRVDTIAHPVIGPGNRVQQFKDYAISYDANGSITRIAGLGGGSHPWGPSTDTTWFHWNPVGQLTWVKRDSAGVQLVVDSMLYDALGQRVAKTVNGVTTWYVYDRGQRTLDVAASTKTMTAEYAWDGPNDLYGMRTPARTMIAINDANTGSVFGLVDAVGGAVVKDYYDSEYLVAWGSAPDTGLEVPFRMGGQEYDREDSLYHLGARYYSPLLGRFLSEDPAGIAGGLNLYAYAGNDPVDAEDPSGLGGPCVATVIWPYSGHYDDEGNFVYDWIGRGIVTNVTCPSSSSPSGAPGGSGTPNGTLMQQQKVNYCVMPGSAPSPVVYQEMGANAHDMLFNTSPEGSIAGAGAWGALGMTLNFAKWMNLDAQSHGSGRLYANYVYGVYMSALGLSLTETLGAANTYGALHSTYRFGTDVGPRDPVYTHIPASNVAAITAGFGDQQNGSMCSTR